MKKFLLLIAVSMLSFVGCKDGSMYPLNDSVWKATVEILPTQNTQMTIFFYQTTFKLEAKATINGVEEIERSEGTYIYNHPKISMTTAGDTESGTIDNNKLTIDGYTFIRQ